MRVIRNIRTLVARELYSYFCSPIAYVFLVIFLVLLGIFTFGDMLGSLYSRGVADLEIPFFTWHPWLFMILVPAIGMRMWSEEKDQGTLELLGTLPIHLWEAIVAKFLAGVFVLLLALFLTLPVVLTVNYLGDPDNGKIFCGYLGSALMAAAFLGISSLTSSLTRNQVVSFIFSMVIGLLLILCGFPAITTILRQWHTPAVLLNFITDLSVYSHYASLQRGVIDSRDLVYFGVVIAFGLFGTNLALQDRR